MRDIKFRAYDKPGKLMVYSGLEFNTDIDGDEHNSYIYLVPSNNASKFYELTVMDNGRVDKMEFEGELMQYTGLKDKNGVEIYEGDILVFHRFNEPISEMPKHAVKWIDGWARFDTAIPHSLDEMPHNPESIEVIGNIYENKDLLK